MLAELKAPFPWFGGKRRVASLVWERLGDVDNFIEPFAGSAAVLLGRPHAPRVETLNDVDCMVANFWRATGSEAGCREVARWTNNPVNEADLHATHRWLVMGEDAAEFRRRMRTERDYFDPKVAGLWCWGLCCWIGGGWCSAGEDSVEWEQRAKLEGNGVHAKRPKLGGGARRPKIDGGPNQAGTGVHKKGPKHQMPTVEQCRTGGKGVNGAGIRNGGRPQLGDAYDIGRGVNANKHAGTCAERLAWLVEWFGRLRDRLRLVRVCCGDWLRVCDSESVTTRLGVTGIFFDPPYAMNLKRLHAWLAFLAGKGSEPKARTAGGGGSRNANLYATDHADIDRLVADVHRYCLERGDDRRMRIALAGYEGEHEPLERRGWSVVEWETQAGYGNRSEVGKANAKRERLWFSPHCLKPGAGLFDGFGG